MAGMRHRQTANRHHAGLTLVELLVTLVLVSMLGTLLVQSIAFFAAHYERVQRVARDSARTDLQQRWFASSVQGLVPLGIPARRFAGGPAEFRGTTLLPLEAAAGLPVQVHWSIAAGQDDRGLPASVVGYAEDGGPKRRVLAQAGPLAFQYADSAQTWHSRWPPITDQEPSPEWTPSQVRLMAGEPARELWRANVDASPTPRLTQSQRR